LAEFLNLMLNDCKSPKAFSIIWMERRWAAAPARVASVRRWKYREELPLDLIVDFRI